MPVLSETERKELFDACNTGDVATVRKFLDQGCDPNETNSVGYTPLIAAGGGMKPHEDLFFELLQRGANVRHRSKYGGSVLTSISCNGTVRMIKAVLSGLTEGESDQINEALYYACTANNIEVIQALVDAGADVNYVNKGTPIINAVMKKRPDVVALLLKHKAKADVRQLADDCVDKKFHRRTALEIAIMNGSTEIAEMLQKAGAKLPKPKPRPEAGTVAESWKLIKKWFKDNAPDWKALQKGATAKQITGAEQQLGFKLPDELRESYETHNGGGDIFPIEGEEVSYYLLDAGELVSIWLSQKELVDGGDFDEAPELKDPRVQDVWWHTNWIPFAHNGAGDLVCVDLAPGSEGVSGQVITHNHETGEHQVLSTSLREWLHTLAYDMRDGKYSVDGESIA